MALKPFNIPIVAVGTQANTNDKIVLNVIHIYAHTYIQVQVKPGKSE